MDRQLLGFPYRFEGQDVPSAARTLLLLHGTGGSEDDLLEDGAFLDPDANLLSPRGKVLENGVAPRFFKRFPDGKFDEEDLIARVAELIEFINAAADEHGFDRGNVWAVGYSNGANTASGMMMLHPNVLQGAVLFRGTVPLEPSTAPDLNHARVLICAGDFDEYAPPERVRRLAEMFQSFGADVTLMEQLTGHALNKKDFDFAQE